MSQFEDYHYAKCAEYQTLLEAMAQEHVLDRMRLADLIAQIGLAIKAADELKIIGRSVLSTFGSEAEKYNCLRDLREALDEEDE